MTNVIPGAFPNSSLSPISVNGTPVDSINEAVAINQRVLGNQRIANDNRFWSSTPRLPGDGAREVYIVSLNTAQQINFVSMELSRFPHRAWVQYRDPADNLWYPVKELSSHSPLMTEITDSLPARITQIADREKKIHPMHFGAGHWVSYREQFQTVFASAIRIVMVRIDGKIPLDRLGQAVPYPLGVRNFYVGLDAHSRDQIPRTPFVSDSERRTFASGVDVLRSNLSFAMRENRAEGVQTSGVWRSEPQPVPNAVVNFYVDSRDSNGDPQVVDRFFLEPLYTGPKINLYYSDSPVADPDRPGRDDPIRTGSIRYSASVSVTGAGITFPATDGYVSIDNSGLRYDLGRPWWFGVTLRPKFDSTESAADRVIFSVGANRREGDEILSRVEDILSLRWSASDGTWLLRYNGSQVNLPPTNPFSVNQTISLIAVYDGTAIRLYDADAAVVIDGEPVGSYPTNAASPWDGLLPDRLVFGTESDETSPDTGWFSMDYFVLKNRALSGADIQAYQASPADYVVDKAYPYLDDDSTRGALLRFAETYQNIDLSSGTGFFGFVGGSLINWDDTVWVPVNRDFDSRRGMLAFNPVKASAFKFEFYDLSPQIYDSQVVIHRPVRLFPMPVVPQGDRRLMTSGSDKGGVGAAVSVEQGNLVSRFSDSGIIGVQREGRAEQPYTPTEALYAEDPAVAAQMRVQGSSLDYLRWHQAPARFRFTGRQVHRYRISEVKHDHRMAFFAGIKSLQMFRVDYEVDEDTDQYLEVFHDARYIEADPSLAPLSYVPGQGLTSGPLSGATVLGTRSKGFSSRKKVRGVQFATTQSDPVQLLSNPDFDDTSLSGWASTGDANISSSERYLSTIGTTVEVKRTSRSNLWSAMEAIYPTWADLPAGLWSQSTALATQSGGITSTEFALPTTVGRIYAAARVFSPATLDQDLSLQIVAEDGEVLAEADMKVLGGAVTEWFVGYTVGDAAAVITARTWGDVETAYPLWSDAAGLRWEEVAEATQSYVGRVGARLIQKQGSSDVFYVDNISLFDDPIQWEFSNNDGADWYPVFGIRNNPTGAFVFPDQGNVLRWRVQVAKPDAWVSAIDIRPLYVEEFMGVPFREGIERGDANVAHWDHYNPIWIDPRFKMWNKPIPEWWYFTNRQWLLRQTPLAPAKFAALPEIIASPPGA